MNVELKQPLRAQTNRLQIVDCDIHPVSPLTDLYPWLSHRWRTHLETYGVRMRHGFAKGAPYPKAQPAAARRDAWPPDGGQPATDIAFMAKQHFDLYGIDYGVMNPLRWSGQGEQNIEFSAALGTAANELQKHKWVAGDRRLKASVIVPYEDGEASAAEIRRRAGDRDFVQVLLLSRTAEALGRQRYWPIYEAAAEAGLPVGIHAFGYSGWAMTNGGWPSFYIEEMTEHATSAQAVVVSMIMEGLFERFPTLKIVLIECGFGWLPALGWRLDKHWKTLKHEVPHLKRAPSEYIREHIYVSTQPMEEPQDGRDLTDIFGWIGWDHVLFASDYPHWDFDDPFLAIPANIGEERRRMLFADNAKRVFRLE
jgi:predicted TIM-barrel fold metal-dependent hydrolase